MCQKPLSPKPGVLSYPFTTPPHLPFRWIGGKAEQYGGNVQYHTISNWISHGRADVAAGQPSTAYARFTKLYRDLIAEHCQPDNNRNRELDQALEILERTCECGNDKMLLPDGKLGNTCQECQDLDALQRRQRTA